MQYRRLLTYILLDPMQASNLVQYAQIRGIPALAINVSVEEAWN